MSEGTPRLQSTYLGLNLDGPLIASASPLTGRMDSLLALEYAGAAAVVLPSLFEEDVIAEEMAFHESMEQGSEMFAEFTEIMPEVPMPDLGPDRHLRLVEQAKQHLSIPVIASVNAAHSGSWSRYATQMADAGADAIELNVYAVATDPHRTAAEVEASYLDIVREVKAAVRVPLAIKLSPYYSSLAHFAGQCVQAGADGLVLFNRFYAPDIDLDALTVNPTVDLSRPSDLRLPLRWLGILRSQLPGTSLACTSGVHSGHDVIKALLVGADVACTTSAVIHEGAEKVKFMLAELSAWLQAHDYDSVEQLRSSMSATNSGEAAAFERSQYINIITSLSRR